MKTATRSKLMAALAELETQEDWKEALQIWKLAQSARQQRALVTFRVGDRVAWTGKAGENAKGVILKVNKTRILVRQDNGSFQLWNIAPSMLRKEEKRAG